MRALRSLHPWVPLLWLTLACASPDLLRPAPSASEERLAFERAMAVAERSPTQGTRELESFVARWPTSPLADDAEVRLAELDLERGLRGTARQRLYRTLAQHPRGDRTHAARVLLARVELEGGDLDAAWRAVSRLRLSLLEQGERRDAHRLLAALSRARGDAAQELHWLSRVAADATDPDRAETARARTDTLVATLADAELVAAAERLERRTPAARLWLEAAERALAAGDVPRAGMAIERARELPLTPEQAERHVQLEQALSGWQPGPMRDGLPPRFADVAAAGPPAFTGLTGTLGAVLPMSGPLAGVAEETLRGVLLAADVFADGSDPSDGVRVLVRDSQGRPEGAAAAVRDLAREPALSAVIGPLLAEEARAAAEVAERARLPLLALTRNEDVVRGRSFVFRLGITPWVEAEALADYAVQELGLTRFAILYPRDRYGREFEQLFWRAVEARGAQVVGVASYQPGDTDFGEPIRELVGYKLLTPDEKAVLARRRSMLDRAKRMPPEAAAALRAQARALTGPGGAPLPPIVDFEALFIPDSHDKVALIAPQLAFHEVEGVRLLGTSGWNHSDLIRIGQRHVEGAVFTAAFDETSRFPLVQEFTRRYQEAYGEAPGVFAAQAFDATNLALLQLVRGYREPEALRRGLLEVRAYPGVSGVTAVMPDGNAQKRPFLVGVRRGRFVSLE